MTQSNVSAFSQETKWAGAKWGIRVVLALSMAVTLILSLLFFLAWQLEKSSEGAGEEKSWVLSFVENWLSTPDRQIGLHNIEGSLSSQARIGEITIADRQGIWLRIRQAKIDWNRAALLTGRISVNRLTAGRIDILRRPLSDPYRLPDPRAAIISVPVLPFAVNIDEFSSPQLVLGNELFGRTTRLSLTGGLELADGDLASQFHIRDLDGQGYFDFIAAYAQKDGSLKLDFDLREPENGVVANMLDIEARPDIAMRVVGEGSLDALDINLSLLVAGETVMDGQLRLRQAEAHTGRHFSLDLGGYPARLLPPIYRPFFGATTRLALEGFLPLTGGMQIDTLNLDGEERVWIKAQADISPDGFLRQLMLDAHLGSEESKNLSFPVSAGEISLKSAQLTLAYGKENQQEWHGNLHVKDLDTPDLGMYDVILDMGGRAENLDDPAKRHVGIFIYGGARPSRAITSPGADIDGLLPDAISILIDADMQADRPVILNNIEIFGDDFSARIRGQLENWLFDGTARLAAKNMASFAAIMGRDISGQAEIEAKGNVHLISRVFALDIQGKMVNLHLGDPGLTRLLQSETSLTGRMHRDEKALHVEQFMFSNEAVLASARGELDNDGMYFDASLEFEDLGLIDPRMQGRARLQASAHGHNDFVNLSGRGEVFSARLLNRNLNNADISFNAFLDNNPDVPHLAGRIDGKGIFDGKTLRLGGNFIRSADERRFDNLHFQLGEAQISGALNQDSDHLLNGRLDFDIVDLSDLAALALIEGSGTVQGEIHFSAQNGGSGNREQAVDIAARASHIQLADSQMDMLDVSARLDNLDAGPRVDGRLEITALRIGAHQLDRLEMTSHFADGASHMILQAESTTIGQAQAQATLTTQPMTGFNLALEQLHFRQGIMEVQLRHPAHIILDTGGDVHIGETLLQIGADGMNGGTAVFSGEIAEFLALDVRLEALPAAFANFFQPQLQAQGIVNGQLHVSGTRHQPQVTFNLEAADVSMAFLQKNGITPLKFLAQGTTSDKRLDLQAKISDGDNLELAVQGHFEMPEQVLDVNLILEKGSLVGLAGLVKAPELTGQMSGMAHFGGTLTNPEIKFDMRAVNIASRMLVENRLSPLAVELKGRLEQGTVIIENLGVNGSQDLYFTASGRVPISGSGLDLQARGQVPLALGNHFLAARGAQLSGSLTLDATLAGTLVNPLLGGSFTIRQGQIIDPQSNSRLNDITINGNLTGEQINLVHISAASFSGGSLSGSGQISTRLTQGLPANIVLNLDHMRYHDGEMVAATLDGHLTLVGPLLNDFELGGKLLIERVEINVPNLSGNVREIEIQHKNISQALATTLRRAGIDTNYATHPASLQRPQATPYFNLEINAPARIFVRGRGLDAELGGTIRLAGPVNLPRPSGRFDLIRGRFDILTKRFELDEGRITLTGNLNPALYFVARTQGNGIDVSVIVQGTPADLSFSFTSQPELPQDEVLAFLIFNRHLSELSPLQIARLAASAAEFAGISGSSLIGRLRDASGFDDLDVSTDAEGNAHLRAGRYLRDNIYLGVEADSEGQTRGTINLDITKDLKVKGAVGSDANSSLGIFYEKDY